MSAPAKPAAPMDSWTLRRDVEDLLRMRQEERDMQYRLKIRIEELERLSLDQASRHAHLSDLNKLRGEQEQMIDTRAQVVQNRNKEMIISSEYMQQFEFDLVDQLNERKKALETLHERGQRDRLRMHQMSEAVSCRLSKAPWVLKHEEIEDQKSVLEKEMQEIEQQVNAVGKEFQFLQSKMHDLQELPFVKFCVKVATLAVKARDMSGRLAKELLIIAKMNKVRSEREMNDSSECVSSQSQSHLQTVDAAPSLPTSTEEPTSATTVQDVQVLSVAEPSAIQQEKMDTSAQLDNAGCSIDDPNNSGGVHTVRIGDESDDQMMDSGDHGEEMQEENDSEDVAQIENFEEGEANHNDPTNVQPSSSTISQEMTAFAPNPELDVDNLNMLGDNSFDPGAMFSFGGIISQDDSTNPMEAFDFNAIASSSPCDGADPFAAMFGGDSSGGVTDGSGFNFNFDGINEPDGNTEFNLGF